MKIVFDMDGVLANFNAGFRELANGMFGTPVESTPEGFTWDNYGGGITEDQVNRVWDRIKSGRTFWISLAPLVTPEESKRIRVLEKEHELYFVTSRVGKAAKVQTEDWLEYVCDLLYPTVIMSSRKGEVCNALGADYCIDDKAGNATYVQYHSPKTRSYLFDAPYNRFDHEVLGSKVRRVKSVTEYLDDIEAGR